MDEEAMELLARQAVNAGVSRSSFAQAAEHYWDQADEELRKPM